MPYIVKSVKGNLNQGLIDVQVGDRLFGYKVKLPLLLLRLWILFDSFLYEDNNSVEII